MKRLVPRWRLPQSGRRLLLRWRAARMSPDVFWPDAQPEAGITGIPLDVQERAIEAACRMLGVQRIGSLRSGLIGRSIGTEARDANGRRSWLKVSEATESTRRWSHGGERAVRQFGGIATPAILEEREWVADGRPWHVFQFALAPSPSIQRTPWISAPMPSLDDAWFAVFKQTMDRLAEAPLGRWLVHPGAIARTIARRFGRRAPYDIDEWRMAHGDLNWSNLTAPAFVLLDWERWGAAPRGYDIAALLALTARDRELYQRIESVFAEDLETTSGVAARLYNIARRLNRIEAGFHDPREYEPLEREAKRLIRS